jgi:hypothetical protein
MTVSCGNLGPNTFTSYTSAATSVPGESLFDIDMLDGLVGILGKSSGAPVLRSYSRMRHGGDFLAPIGEFPVSTAIASGALLLPSIQ